MSVLIVEDEFLIAEMLIDMIEDFGMKVCGHAVTAEETIKLAREHAPHIVMMDVCLKGKEDGIYAAEEIAKFSPSTLVIFLTGSVDAETLEQIDSVKPVGVLHKPFRFAQLKTMLEKVSACLAT
ncbi:unnamed protein product [Sphagnum tenellum]